MTFLFYFFQDFPKLNIVGWKMERFCRTFHQNTFTRSNRCPAPMLATIDVTPKIVWAPLFPKRSSSRWHVSNLFFFFLWFFWYYLVFSTNLSNQSHKNMTLVKSYQIIVLPFWQIFLNFGDFWLVDSAEYSQSEASNI